MNATRCFCLLLFAILVCTGRQAEAQNRIRGKVPGAMWQYEMNQVADASVSRSGKFRITGDNMFQPRNRRPTKIGAIEGQPPQKPAKGDKVKVAFDSLRAEDDTELKCRGTITFDSFGEVHGRLLDSDGKHWNFKASRVQE
jgi:hypothetical protein